MDNILGMQASARLEGQSFMQLSYVNQFNLSTPAMATAARELILMPHFVSMVRQRAINIRLIARLRPQTTSNPFGISFADLLASSSSPQRQVGLTSSLFLPSITSFNSSNVGVVLHQATSNPMSSTHQCTTLNPVTHSLRAPPFTSSHAERSALGSVVCSATSD